MTSIVDCFRRLQRKLLKMRLQPIRVFCFHQVSDEFEPDTMKGCDWMQTEAFKRTVLALKNKYTFISLLEMKGHIKRDTFRTEQYAVLTADDGWSSLKNILPWLAEQNIPVTLFLNPSYLDGEHFRERDTEKYLSLKELENYTNLYKNLSVALHGWEHKDVSSLSELKFREDIEKSKQILGSFSCYIPYYAYPWGRHNSMNDNVLYECGMTPVLMDGMKNYSDSFFVHRELLEP